MRLHEAVIGRRDGRGNQTSKLEVGLKRFEAAVGVRNQADAQTAGCASAGARRHFVIHLEVLAGRPFVVDLASARMQVRAGARPSAR